MSTIAALRSVGLGGRAVDDGGRPAAGIAAWPGGGWIVGC